MSRNLENNQISWIPSGTFRNLTSLQSLYIDQFKLFCICEGRTINKTCISLYGVSWRDLKQFQYTSLCVDGTTSLPITTSITLQTTIPRNKSTSIVTQMMDGPLSRGSFPVVAIYIIVLAFILFLVGIMIYRIRKKLKKKRADQEEILAMAPWEVPLNAVVLETKIGHGAFGVVWRGKLTTIPEWVKESSVATSRKAPRNTVRIAVKTINEEADCYDKLQFLREIDMMKNVGHHINIVNMIACCVKVDPPLLIMEFVAYGDLQKFLRKRRDQIAGKAKSYSKYYAMEGYKNLGDAALKYKTFVKPEETTVLNEKETDTEHSNGIKKEINSKEKSANNANKDDIKEKDVEDVATAQKFIVQEDDKDNEGENYFQKPLEENGQEEFENDKEMEGEDNAEKANEEVDDDDDYEEEEEEEEELFPEDLLSFAWQITKGMEYLSNKGYIHRDLAARNVFIGHGKVAKVADFGLSREMSSEDQAYRVKTATKLPIKWMSPESIFDMVFTSKSDVWSFGIVLWEIITLGGAPYPSIGNQLLLNLLKHRYRMEKPEFCSDEIYELMIKCWDELPENRPSFTKLRAELAAMMNANKQYLDLMNIEDTPEYMNLGSDNENETADQMVFDNMCTSFRKKSSHELETSM